MLKYAQFSLSTTANHEFISRFQPNIFYLCQIHPDIKNLIFILVVLNIDIIIIFFF